MILLRHYKVYRVGIWVLMAALLTACSSKDEFADIKQFMADIDSQPKGRIPPLPEFEPYQPFTYGASNRRSPFEPPVIVPPMSEEQKKNIGVKPPVDHVKQYLERFNIASLNMVGTLERDNNRWALIEDPNGGVHRVQVGDYMGTSWGKIESIEDSRIDLVEIVSDGQGGWLRRPRTVNLKGTKE